MLTDQDAIHIKIAFTLSFGLTRTYVHRAINRRSMEQLDSPTIAVKDARRERSYELRNYGEDGGYHYVPNFRDAVALAVEMCSYPVTQE